MKKRMKSEAEIRAKIEQLRTWIGLWEGDIYEAQVEILEWVLGERADEEVK